MVPALTYYILAAGGLYAVSRRSPSKPRRNPTQTANPFALQTANPFPARGRGQGRLGRLPRRTSPSRMLTQAADNLSANLNIQRN